MYIELDEKSDVPLWVQLKSRLSYLIYSQAYQFGDQLPTVRELSSRLKIAYNTVSKVYRDLERDGLIRTKQGSGTFVVFESLHDSDDPLASITACLSELASRGREAGMNDDEIVDALRSYLERTT